MTAKQAIFERLRDVRLHRSNLRLVVLLPAEFQKDSAFVSNLITLAIYDLYFEEEVDTETLTSWLKDRKTLTDVQNLISFDDSVTHLNLEDSLEETNPVVEPEVTVKEKIVVKKVIEEKYISIPRNTVGVVSLSKKAGASFISLNLAHLLAENKVDVALLENPLHETGRTYLFDVMDMQGKEKEGKRFYSVPHAIAEGKSIQRELFEKYKGIEFLFTDSRLSCIDEWSYERYLKYINFSKAAVTVMDFGTIDIEDGRFKGTRELLKELDQVIVVCDPQPHELITNQNVFNYFELQNEDHHGNVQFIFNKWNDGIEKGMLADIGVDLKRAIKIPFVAPKFMYSALYKGIIPHECKEIQLCIDKELSELASMFLPEVKIRKKNRLIDAFKMKGMRG